LPTPRLAPQGEIHSYLRLRSTTAIFTLIVSSEAKLTPPALPARFLRHCRVDTPILPPPPARRLALEPTYRRKQNTKDNRVNYEATPHFSRWKDEKAGNYQSDKKGEDEPAFPGSG
jgi:hypothetical protein